LPWHINLCRQRIREDGEEHSALSPTGVANFHEPMKFAHFYGGRSHQFDADPSVTDFALGFQAAMQKRKPEPFLALAAATPISDLQKAAALEQAGAFQRALLAYERILDLAESDPEQIQSAVSAIRRLKPTLPDWHPDPENAVQAVIHIGTGEKFADFMPGILTVIIRDLNTASSGIVKFSHELHIGRTIQTTDAPTPVALWITGPGDDAISTDVLSFTTENKETLRNDLLKTAFNLVRAHLAKSASYNPAPEALDDPLAALESHITRLLWNEFGKTLSPQP
jgi:hypothetical protein